MCGGTWSKKLGEGDQTDVAQIIVCVSSPNKGTLLFDGNAKEAFDKATEANGGELKIKENSVTWQVLEGDEEKEVLKKIIEAQQETYKSKGRGRGRSGGRGRGGGGRRGRGGRDQGKTQYQGKKTKFDSDEEDAPATTNKRELEEADGPAAKVAKTENGS